MRKLILPVIASTMLAACAGDDADSSDSTTVVASESPDATSLEDCSNVSLSTTRINAAARTTVNTELTFDNALAVWRMPVSTGQELTAEMNVPADKDYTTLPSLTAQATSSPVPIPREMVSMKH